jgi:hypothetical protein
VRCSFADARLTSNNHVLGIVACVEHMIEFITAMDKLMSIKMGLRSWVKSLTKQPAIRPLTKVHC